MRQRILACCVLLAAGISGLLFAPVFGIWPLVLPVAAILVTCYAIVELCMRFRSLQPWRPVLALVVGLVALAEISLQATTFGGLPTMDTVRALAAGLTNSWQLTLQSTWPVRPEAELLLFVPLLVLFAAVLGIELLRWPAAALLPSVVVLVLSQAFVAMSGTTATVAALGYAVVAAGLFMASRSRPGKSLLVPTVVLSVAGAAAISLAGTGNAYSLQQNHSAPASMPRTLSPLTEVAARLAKPDVPVFSYTSDGQVDRWRMVVLNEFNGVTWSPPDQYHKLGAQIGPQPSVTVPTTAHTARLTVPAGDEPWVPSQAMPASVTGAAPLINQTSGMLLLPGRTGPLAYDLSWWEPEVGQTELEQAAISPAAAAGSLGVIPPGIAELARTATNDMRPSVKAAFVLERYLSQNYKVATGAGLPTGSGWPQLREFLLDTKRGTSEQFAASYVALARIVGIPARLAVGYRAPAPSRGQVTVHNRDVLAWPEIPVAGVGWVPLDPVGTASGAGPGATHLAQVTAKVRAELPPPADLPDPPLPASGPGSAEDGGDGIQIPVLPILLGIAGLIILVAAGIPLAKAVRTLRRRRQTGARGVVAAWWEARDLLLAYGAPVTPGMTARDLARTVTVMSIVDGLTGLAGQLDNALWSGRGDGNVTEAWAAVRAIRRGLGDRPLTARIRAVFDPRSLI